MYMLLNMAVGRNGGGDPSVDIEDYPKLNLKKYSPIAAFNESRNVCNGPL